MTALLVRDLLLTLRSRRVKLAAAMAAYAVIIVPLLIARPPAHVDRAMAALFGASDAFTRFLYVWTDLAMNKMVCVIAVLLAGGVLLRERDLRELTVLLSKPISPAGYFLTRVASAGAAMALLHVGAHLCAWPLLLRAVPGFRSGVFLASMSVHLFSALFAVAFAASATLLIGRRAAGAVTSLVLLLLLVSAAFLGVYNPAWAAAALVNPFSHGVSVVEHAAGLRPAHIVVPIAAQAAFIAVTLAAGALAARRVEA